MPNLPHNAKLWILQIASGEYDSYHVDNISIVTDESLANTWLKLGHLDGQTGNDFQVELINLNVMNAHWRDKIDQFCNPARNPLCECGHSLMEHNRRGYKRCHHNRPQTHPDAHFCNGFRLAKSKK